MYPNYEAKVQIIKKNKNKNKKLEFFSKIQIGVKNRLHFISLIIFKKIIFMAKIRTRTRSLKFVKIHFKGIHRLSIFFCKKLISTSMRECPTTLIANTFKHLS